GTGIVGLTALYYAADSGDPALIAKKDHIIDEMIKTQSPSGYIGVFQEEADGSHLFTEYCLHECAYIIYAFAEDYRLFHRDASLAAGKKFADYLIDRWKLRPPGEYYTTMGLEEAYEALYGVTGDARYLRFAAEEPRER